MQRTIAGSKLSKITRWDGKERRGSGRCRRRSRDRRSLRERRLDHRQGHGRKRSLVAWIRSVFRARLGVDRRKKSEQRGRDRRYFSPRSLLTKDELRDLLA